MHSQDQNAAAAARVGAGAGSGDERPAEDGGGPSLQDTIQQAQARLEDENQMVRRRGAAASTTSIASLVSVVTRGIITDVPVPPLLFP